MSTNDAPLTGPASAPAATVANNFLGDDHSATHALRAVEPLLASALAPTERPFPEQHQPDDSFSPHALGEKLDAIDLARPLGDLDQALEELYPIWLDHAVRYDSPRYLAHLNCPITEASFAAAIVSAGMNTAVETWDQARGAALIEDRLIHWLADTAGMDADSASGVFTSGGTQSNLQALYTAREKATSAGAKLEDLMVICSAESHYSISRSCHILGLPEDCILALPTTEPGALDPGALTETLEELHRDPSVTVMCLALTAGTTDLGAIDPLHESITAARRHNIHVHVDCAYGGALLVSPTRRHRLAGLELADSFSVDFHKSFFQPVACSALVYRDHHDLAYVSWYADYLNPEADERLNLADRSLQTTRRFDALKLWLTLRTAGSQAIGKDFDTCCELAISAAQLARATPDIEVLTEPNLSTLLFRYSPTDAPPTASPVLDHLNTTIRRHLFDSNLAIIGSTQRRGATWLKFTLLNPSLTLADIGEILTLIRHTGDHLLSATPHH